MEVQTVDAFVDYCQRIHYRTSRIIEVVPPERLEWSYSPGKFTIGDIIRHIVGMERYMYAEIAAGRPNAYPGCEKELAEGFDNVWLYYRRLREESMQIFKGLTNETLLEKCTTPAGIQISVGKWLRAMIEHEIHHRAQLYTYLGLLEIKTPPIFGMTAEEVASLSIVNK